MQSMTDIQESHMEYTGRTCLLLLGSLDYLDLLLEERRLGIEVDSIFQPLELIP